MQQKVVFGFPQSTFAYSENLFMELRLLYPETALLTARTVVRRWREGEGKLLYDLVQRNQSWYRDISPAILRALDNPEKAEWFVRSAVAGWVMQEEYNFGVWTKEEAQLIGVIRLFGLNWDVPLAEMGYFIDYDQGKKGLMTEAAYRVVQFAFQQLHLEKIQIKTSSDNYASQRLARKLGFRREGDLRADFRTLTGELLDAMVLGLTPADFGV